MNWFVALIFLFLFSPAQAQESDQTSVKVVPQKISKDVPQKIPDNEYPDFFTVVFENDSIGSGTDQNYTNGVRFTYFNIKTTKDEFPEIAHTLAEQVPTFSINDESSVYYSFGQNLYTPDDITSSVQGPNDRPWAAFIYGAIGMATKTDDHIDELEATIGIVGPAAIGRQVQTFVHRSLTSSPIPRGWSNQLENEPGLILSWQRRWPTFHEFETEKLNFIIGPHIGISLGNVYTYGNAGISFRLSSEKSKSSDTPLRVRPALPGTGYYELFREGWGWSLFGGIEGRAVARNIFLDGSTFVSSHSVTKFPVVGDANIGIAFKVWRIRMSYTLVLRSKEFKTQARSDLFGAASLSYRF